MNEQHLELLNALNEVRDTLPDSEGTAPSRTRIISILKQIMVVLMPEYFHYRGMSQAEALESFENELVTEIAHAFSLNNGSAQAEDLARQFTETLPEIKRLILTDIQAIYEGDPAAKSKAEIVLCYPGFFAISIYRVAHVLYKLGIPLIPRIMTEYAHEKTGVDIHPGATIGEYFCIDHGTGVVVGETSTIGQHVKLYQGVTIGAKSFERDAHGNLVKGGKRHPDIGSYVVIYANATILGGTTKIGDHAVIGGSAWITFSVGAGETVMR